MMKPRNREINIFNLSMLDVISGAMGAFLIIMVVLFPYYKKETIDYRREIQQMKEQAQAAQAAQEAARKALAEAEQARSRAEAQAQESRQKVEAAQRQLAKTFLVIHIQWETPKQDVDLHIIDPSGAEFYYEKKTIPGHPGELSVDSQFGPGNEVWTAHDAKPGDYQVYANLYNTHGETRMPVIIGRVIHRDGGTSMPNVALRESNKKTLVATVTVDQNGAVTVH